MESEAAHDLELAELSQDVAPEQVISVHLRPFELSGVLIGYHETQE